MKKTFLEEVLFLLSCSERTQGESRNPPKTHLPCPSLLVVPPGACGKPRPQRPGEAMDPTHECSPNADTLRMPSSPFLEINALRLALTHFFPFPPLEKPTGAGKSSYRQEVVRQLLGERT